MRVPILTIGLLAAVAIVSGCSSTQEVSGFHRGIEGGVDTSKGAFAAMYSSWCISTAEPAEVGAGVIAPLDFAGDWSLKRRSSLGSPDVVVIVIDSEGKEQQRFVAKPSSIYLLETPTMRPRILADNWEAKQFFDWQNDLGQPRAQSFDVYTRDLLENSTD